MTAVETNAKPLRGPLRKRESHLWSRDPHDWYCEPSWVSARLFAMEAFEGRVWDPACGAGQKPGNGTTDYAWLIWLRGFDGRPELGWLRRDA